VHPRRPISKYAGGAAASGRIILIQEFYSLICSKGSPPPSLLSVTIQFQGPPENEQQGIRRAKINLHAPVATSIRGPLGAA
jgi:hypothetical protein